MAFNIGLFIRPSKFRLSNPIQVLAVANHVSEQLGGCMHFHFPRDPEQQRLLNYGVMVPSASWQSRRVLAGNPFKFIRVPFPRSIAETSNQVKRSRDISGRIGLRDVAPLIGLKWNSRDKLPGERPGQKYREAGDPYRNEEDETWIEVKLERARGRTE